MQIKLSNDISLWLRRLLFYSILCAAVIIITHLIFSYFGFLHTDVDSARYMLSALVQGEFAVLAIVVSFSIVASQLAAQSYSTRVIEMFRKNPDLKIIGCIYVLSIFYGLGVLKLLEKANPELCAQEFICQSTLEAHIAFSYYLAIFAATAMVPYVRNTVELLKPSTIINMLAKKITKENILSAIRKRQENSDEQDPIQPVIDIVRGALMKYDYEAVKDGLRAIGEHINFIFDKEILDRDEELRISKHIFSHLARVGKLAASKNDEDVTLEVMYTLHKNGLTAAEHRLQSALLRIEESFEEIGKVAIEYKLEEATQRAIISLANLAKASAEYRLENALSWGVEFLGMLGQSATKHKLRDVTLLAINSLEEIGKSITMQKYEYVAKVIEALEKIGIAAADGKYLGYATVKASKSLVEIGKLVAEQKFEDDVVTQKVIVP